MNNDFFIRGVSRVSCYCPSKRASISQRVRRERRAEALNCYSCSSKNKKSELHAFNVLGVARSTMTNQSKDWDEDALKHGIIKLVKMCCHYKRCEML